MKQPKKGIYIINRGHQTFGTGYWSYHDLTEFNAILIYDEQNFPLKKDEVKVFEKLLLKRESFFD